MAKESAYFIARSVYLKHDKAMIKNVLDELHGMTSVFVDTKNDLVSVEYDSAGLSYDKIENCLNKLGYEIAADASNIHTR